MNFIDLPNVPQRPVTLAVVDGRIPSGTELALSGLGVNTIKTGRHPDLYEAVAWHPDMFLHHTGGDSIVYAPGTDGALLRALEDHGFRLIKGGTTLAPGYPADIAYNVARIGSFYFHNLRYTDPVLRNILENMGLTPVNVNQGYSKCSVSIVGENSIITSDTGIAMAAGEKGIEVLLIAAGQNILLPGLDYGFIGGSSGLLGKKNWAISGPASQLEAYPAIFEFLAKRNVSIVSLDSVQVMDIGTILPLKTS